MEEEEREDVGFEREDLVERERKESHLEINCDLSFFSLSPTNEMTY